MSPLGFGDLRQRKVFRQVDFSPALCRKNVKVILDPDQVIHPILQNPSIANTVGWPFGPRTLG
jgi:hypothetical protein